MTAKSISIWADKELLGVVDKIAKDNGKSRSAILTNLASFGYYYLYHREQLALQLRAVLLSLDPDHPQTRAILESVELLLSGPR